jgi:hypothetical protein
MKIFKKKKKNTGWKGMGICVCVCVCERERERESESEREEAMLLLHVDKVKLLFALLHFSHPPPLLLVVAACGGLEGPDSIAKKLKECPSIICVGGVSSIN